MRWAAAFLLLAIAAGLALPARGAEVSFKPETLFAGIADCAFSPAQDAFDRIEADIQADVTVQTPWAAKALWGSSWLMLGKLGPALQAPSGWRIHSVGLGFSVPDVGGSVYSPGLTYDAGGQTEVFTSDGRDFRSERVVDWSGSFGGRETVKFKAPVEAVAFKHWSFSRTEGVPPGPTIAYVEWIMLSDTPDTFRLGQRRLKIWFRTPKPWEELGTEAKVRLGDPDAPCGEPAARRSPFRPEDVWRLDAAKLALLAQRGPLVYVSGPWAAMADCPWCWMQHVDEETGSYSGAVLELPEGWSAEEVRFASTSLGWPLPGCVAAVAPRARAWDASGRPIGDPEWTRPAFCGFPLRDPGKAWSVPQGAKYLAVQAASVVMGLGRNHGAWAVSMTLARKDGLKLTILFRDPELWLAKPDQPGGSPEIRTASGQTVSRTGK